MICIIRVCQINLPDDFYFLPNQMREIKRKKYFKIDVETESTNYWNCPICKKEVVDEFCWEEDFEILICKHCKSKFEYDWEADENKDIYRYILLPTNPDERD